MLWSFQLGFLVLIPLLSNQRTLSVSMSTLFGIHVSAWFRMLLVRYLSYPRYACVRV